MAFKKELKAEVNQVESLRTLVEAYGEIASIRMKKIRGLVLTNREFLQAISSIFQDTLAAYAQKLSQLLQRGRVRQGDRVTFLSHNGKTVAVLISANTGFYGDVIGQTFNKFLEDVRRDDVEVTIIGRIGRSLFLEAEPNRPYTFFELPDYGLDQTKLSSVIRHLVQYEAIKFYYGQYQSVVRQKPAVTQITAGTPIQKKVAAPTVNFIFEPSLEKILTFFETEIFVSLFDQAIRESQLAKLASRILAMDRSSENIDKRIKELKFENLRLMHREQASKQLNSLASVLHQQTNL